MEQLLMTRRERERMMRRQAMLDAAQAVFAEKGYAGATLDEIAQRAEFGKGTLYNYFEGGKEEILFAIFDEVYDAFCRVIEEAFTPEVAADRPFRDVFFGFVRACFVFFHERQEQFMLLVKEAQRFVFSEEDDKAAYFQQQSERIVDTLVPHLEAAMETGELRRMSPHGISHAVFGNIKGYQMHVCLEHCRRDASVKPFDPDHAAEFVTTLLLDGLLVRPDGARPDPHTQA